MKTKEVQTNYEGMGAIHTEEGVFFRVWAPHASKVLVTGEFNNWSEDQHELLAEENGYWGNFIEEAKSGQQYKYVLHTEQGILKRNDPYAKEVTNSNGNSIILDSNYDWGNKTFEMPAWNSLVIYELHVGTFTMKDGKPGNFAGIVEKLSYLKELGINAIEIMPPTEFPGGFSWGYNPSHPFALEQEYGGANAFKDLVKAAHEMGIAVLIDIVYNHFGPSDLDLWRFDGWSENDKGGIYFYQDWRSETPWGDSRPDYGRPEVRQYIRDNAIMWLDEYKVDGIRTDAIAYVRNVKGDEDPSTDLPDGWSLMKWINEEVRAKFPWKITIAEDLRGNEWITKTPGEGGQGFSAQWDAAFVHPVRAALTEPFDQNRNMDSVAGAVMKYYNGDAFQRIIYTESHDEVANGRARVPEEIAPGGVDKNWFAEKRSTLGAALVMTSPGIPMIFQGQELFHAGWFKDDEPFHWERQEEYKGIYKLYSDLIKLRRNVDGLTAGLMGQGTQIIHVHNDNNVIAFHRWDKGGPKDSVVVVINFADRKYENYNIGMPEDGLWKIRFNSDWKGYSKEFGNEFSYDTQTFESVKDGQGFNANITIAPYSAIILSRD